MVPPVIAGGPPASWHDEVKFWSTSCTQLHTPASGSVAHLPASLPAEPASAAPLVHVPLMTIAPPASFPDIVAFSVNVSFPPLSVTVMLLMVTSVPPDVHVVSGVKVAVVPDT